MDDVEVSVMVCFFNSCQKDTWFDMVHSVVHHQGWVRWLLCNHIIPKAIALSEWLAECTCQTIGKTEGMVKQEPVHPQPCTHYVHHDCAHCGLCALTTTTTNTCTVPVGENHHSVLVRWC